MTEFADIPILRELIAALNRRAPQARPNEAAIARDAAGLKSKALERIAELEREAFAVEPDQPRLW